MKKLKYIIVILILAPIGYGIFKFSDKDLILNQGKDSSEEVVQNDVTEAVPGEVKKVNEDTNTFIHKKYGFSLNFPSDMTASNFIEGGGEQIQFQGRNGEWFQIYITPWDEPEDITVDRIKQDIPDIVIQEPQRVVIGPRQKEGIGPNALIFFSKDSGLGDTREVWFIQNGYLYQITTYKRLDNMLAEILATFQYL